MKTPKCFSDYSDELCEMEQEENSRCSVKSIDVKQDSNNVLVLNKGKMKKKHRFTVIDSHDSEDSNGIALLDDLNMEKFNFTKVSNN